MKEKKKEFNREPCAVYTSAVKLQRNRNVPAANYILTTAI